MSGDETFDDDDLVSALEQVAREFLRSRRAVPNEWQARALAAEAELSTLKAGITNAVRCAVAERLRQVAAEGWTQDHDVREHADGSLAKAAACYALAAAGARTAAVAAWPWPGAPKFGTAVRMLEKATALLLAERERLDRVAASRRSS
jgi:hypothetical protein